MSIFKERSKENNNCNQDDDDDDDDHDIEHLRHSIMLLDKKQGRYHIIVIVLPQGKRKFLKKEKSGKYKELS